MHRDSIDARDLEYKALAEVEILKSLLDERNLESRVKSAIEAEALSQQRLAAAEAEIADLRQKLEASKRLSILAINKRFSCFILKCFYRLVENGIANTTQLVA